MGNCYSRRLKAKEKRSRYGSNHTGSRSDIIKTEEGEKSTTYIIPAAIDSTVKVSFRKVLLAVYPVKGITFATYLSLFELHGF